MGLAIGYGVTFGGGVYGVTLGGVVGEYPGAYLLVPVSAEAIVEQCVESLWSTTPFWESHLYLDSVDVDVDPQEIVPAFK